VVRHSLRDCGSLGSDGVLVLVANFGGASSSSSHSSGGRTPAEVYRDRLLVLARAPKPGTRGRRLSSTSGSGGASPATVDRTYTLIPALHARLDNATLEAVLDDPHAELVEADCRVQLDLQSMRDVPTSDVGTPPATNSTPSRGGDGGTGGASGMAGAGGAGGGMGGLVASSLGGKVGTASSISPVQTSPPWGLDAIDGTDDNRYEHSVTGAPSELGDGVHVYVLDTGVRISHNDFGGRALPGYSAGCPTAGGPLCTGASQGGTWPFEGVLSDSTLAGVACSSHGTHCAGSVGGATYGVAKAATIVAVGALNCDGSAAWSQILAAIEWSVEDAVSRTRQGETTNAVLSLR
jgi:subtilisin family serine protease